MSVVLSVGFVSLSGAASADPVVPSAGSVSDAQVATDVPTARAVAAAFGHPVEVSSLDAVSSSTFVNPDGSVSSRLFPEPVRTVVGGVLVAVDTTLVQLPDGSVAPAALANSVVLSGGGSGPLVSLAEGSSMVSYGWPGSLPVPVLSGSTALYSEVAPGEDLRVTVTDGGVETFLVFRQKPAADQAQLQLSVTVSGGSVSSDAEGHTVFADASGKELAVGSTPAAWDARVNPASGDVTPVAADTGLVSGSGQVTPSLRAGAGSSVVGAQMVQLPASLLDDPSTVYPVTLDPDTPFSQYAFAYVDSNHPDQTYVGDNWDSSQVHMGAEPGTGGINRPMWIIPAGGLVGTHVTKALFKVNETHAWNCTAQPVQLWNTGTWGQGLTWNNQPAANGSWASASFASGYTGCAGVQEAIDATNLVQTLVTEKQVNYYFQLRAGNEADQQQWKKFSTSGTYLEVTYDHIPGAPAGRSVTPCGFGCGTSVSYSNSATPLLAAVAADADGDNLSYNFQVYAGFNPDPLTQSPLAVGSVAPAGYGSTAYWRPVRMGDGNYSYRVQAFDGQVTGSWSAGWVNYVIDTLGPAAPSLTVPTGPFSTVPNSFTGVIGKDSESVGMSNAVSDHVYGYVYWSLQQGGAAVSPTGITCQSGQTVRANGFAEVCLGSGQSSTSAVFSAISESFSFNAVAYDLAGNLSGSASQAFGAQQDTAAVSTQWAVSTGGSSCPSSGSVPESTSTATWSLGLSGSACWQSVNTVSGLLRGVLQFPGTAAAASTSAAVLGADTGGGAASFSVGAWVRPTTTTGTQSVMGQDLTHESTFYLQGAGGQWMFCLPGTDAATWATSGGDCVYSAAGSEVVNQWTYVEGVWDRLNQQLRIYVSTGGASTPAQTGSHAMVPVSGGVLVLGRNRIDDGYRYFTGQICDPSFMQGVISSNQLGLVAPAGATCTKTRP